MPRSESPPDPRALTGADLVMSHFTLGRHHPIEDRVSAAAGAGFAGIGWYLGDYRRLLDGGWDHGRLAALLEHHGVCLAEIEVVASWATDPLDAAERDFEALAWDLADRFGCRYLQAIGPTGAPPPDMAADMASAFGRLCDRAADHGLLVGLEFLPFTAIASLDDARSIVEGAGRPNGGLCLDIWHVTRTGVDAAALAAVPAELVLGVQMSDGPLQPQLPDYKEDCLRHRLPPGDGAFDVQTFVATLLANGVDVPWSVEVCSASGWAGSALDHARRSADAMRRELATARSSRA